MKHYKYLGKYLRAVEKSLLVTSTWDSFPVSNSGEPNHTALVASDSIGNMSLSSSVLSTPLFSPIPFLHDDARRSQSHSPPPSPLMLPSAEVSVSGNIPRADASEATGIGLVDELDDPSPGHLSDHPHPISATTTVDPKPTTLEERFVKAASEEMKIEGEGLNVPTAEAGPPSGTGQEETKSEDEMVVDDPDKENKAE